MSVHDILAAARKIAEEAGVGHADLATLPPREQVSAIQDRIRREILRKEDELLMLTVSRLRRRIAA